MPCYRSRSGTVHGDFLTWWDSAIERRQLYEALCYTPKGPVLRRNERYPSSSRDMLVPKNVGVKNRRAGKTANGNIGVEDGMKGEQGESRRRVKMGKAHDAHNREKSGG
jgi:hypothetical protein